MSIQCLSILFARKPLDASPFVEQKRLLVMKIQKSELNPANLEPSCVCDLPNAVIQKRLSPVEDFPVGSTKVRL